MAVFKVILFGSSPNLVVRASASVLIGAECGLYTGSQQNLKIVIWHRSLFAWRTVKRTLRIMSLRSVRTWEVPTLR